MDHWEIRPAPNVDDPRRHLLLLHGGATDVAAVLKKFGALCGRPIPLDGEEFNLSFVLHNVTPEIGEKINAWLGAISPKSAAPPMPPAPPPLLPPAVRDLEIAAATTPVPVVITPQPPQTATLSALTDELRADWTFGTLLVGAYNRFAHAAAMSVVASPGSMYNPLFLYGVPGTGKSHLLYAIASSMSNGLGSASLFVTSGARLSRAVNAMAAALNIAAIDKKTADSKALLIDDIHLLTVTDQNKDILAKLFRSFFDRGLQVVITSIYPPKALGTLEEALKFKFSKGWSVDLKIPSPNIQRDLISSMNDRFSIQLSNEEVGQLAEKLMMWGYQDLTLWTNRLAVLRKMSAAASQPAPLNDMLQLIYDPIISGLDEPPVSTAGASFAPPAASAGSASLAIIVPNGQEGLIAYVANMFSEAGIKNGFIRKYNYALLETYDAMQLVGVPFQIADLCYHAGVTRALIIGPGPHSPLAPRTAEFGHAVRHILGSSGVATGWIPHAQAHLAAHYINAHLDFEK